MKKLLYLVLIFVSCAQTPPNEELIIGKWKGVAEDSSVNFVMMDNHSLYFYSSSITEMDMFKEQYKEGGNVKPIKWNISEDVFLSFAINHFTKNFEIIELTDNKLIIKDMLEKDSEKGKLVLYKNKLTSFEQGYIKTNNYNQRGTHSTGKKEKSIIDSNIIN